MLRALVLSMTYLSEWWSYIHNRDISQTCLLLFSLLRTISVFIEKEKSAGFLNKDQRLAQIDSYHRQINAFVNAFSGGIYTFHCCCVY